MEEKGRRKDRREGTEGGGKDTGEERQVGGETAKCDSELRGRRKDEKARNALQGQDERGRELRSVGE